MRTAQLRQFSVVERLRAKTRAIDTQRAKGTQLIARYVPGFISTVISELLSI